MAKKTNTLRTPLEACGPGAMSGRQPMPSKTALHLSQLFSQLRPHFFRIQPSGMRRQITVQIEEDSQMPRVVKIIHTDPN